MRNSLLPYEQIAIFGQPSAQPVPMEDERFVGHLDCLVAARIVAAGHEQTSVRQFAHHGTGAFLEPGQAHAPSRILGRLSQLHQVPHDRADQLLVGRR